MSLRTMAWGEGAFRAFLRAFSPMPPLIRKPVMAKMARRVEAAAKDRGADEVGLGDVYSGCREVLAKKEPFMLGSLLRALEEEGFRAEES